VAVFYGRVRAFSAGVDLAPLMQPQSVGEAQYLACGQLRRAKHDKCPEAGLLDATAA